VPHSIYECFFKGKMDAEDIFFAETIGLKAGLDLIIKDVNHGGGSAG
jgi:hypothetical protein